jgi:hypothetical protein
MNMCVRLALVLMLGAAPMMASAEETAEAPKDEAAVACEEAAAGLEGDAKAEAVKKCMEEKSHAEGGHAEGGEKH